MLPQARRQRWQPIRGGLLNIYRYDYQEFRYEDGRLILRGNNGTGKSRVLALQLPFLLDGEIVPQRVEPDQDPAKRMEWNLLLGGKHDDRLGYTWTEFGRLNEFGEAEYKTIGCAMRAVQGRGIAQQWFFITDQRIGQDLFLENEASQPLSRARLEAAVGTHGQVFGSGKLEEDRREYRQAIDKALFQLGDRYDALINLLIQLRQPQLSRTLNEARLSDALSEALPPLPGAVLGDVAEAFRSLETDRQELEDFKAARGSAELFLKEYQRYVQIAARRRAEEVRKANSAYETTMRRLRTAEGEFQAASTALERLKLQLAALSLEESRALAAERTLRDSPEMKDAKALEEARQAARTAQESAEQAGREALSSAQAVARASRQQQSASTKSLRAAEAAAALAARAREAARAAGLDLKHRDAVLQLDWTAPEMSEVDKVAVALRELMERRLEAVGHLRKLNDLVNVARQQFAIAQQAYAHAEGQLQESVEAESEATAKLESSAAAVMAQYGAWVTQLVEMRPPELEAMDVAFATWCDAPEGESPLVTALREAERLAVESLEGGKANARSRLQAARQELSRIESELARLKEGYHELPPALYTRDATGRAERPGAPLWALCDFRPSVSASDRAGFEAALEASGLLDAWVTPDGRILKEGDHDAALGVGISPPAPAGRGLDQILLPAVDREDPRAGCVPDDMVAAVLRQVGCGPDAGACWVHSDGRWQLGPLAGAWHKRASQYIGHASREAARRQRIEELGQELEAARTVVRGIEGELESLAQRRAQLEHETAQSPSDSSVRAALGHLEAARRMVARLRLRLTETEARFQQAQELLTKESTRRDEAATDLGLAGWVEKLPELADLLHRYGRVLAELWPAVRAQLDAQAQLAVADEQCREAEATQNLRDQQRQHAEARAAGAQEVFSTLESTVGAAVLMIQERLREAVERVQSVRLAKDEAARTETEQRVQQAVAQRAIDDANEDLRGKEEQRAGAIAGLETFAATRQLAVAHSEFRALEPGPWSAARAVELARRVEALLHEVESGDEAWARNQKEIHSHFETLQASLRAHGYMPEGSVSDGIFVVIIQFQGRACTIAELRDSVVTIIQERQELLDAREREVLENYLIDEVAEHLHDLLHRALRWKEEINAELSERPMSTGLTLRFVWEPLPELPLAFAEARRLLLGARGTWSPAERTAVGEFLQQQIKAVRAANDTGTWQDHLTQAFDYRKWHQFGVERKQDGVWKRLTRRTHGTGSGGEKAIALTLPQLAAAAAHYRSAGKFAPRLILLDEAFVGVDKNMRAKCMDLLRVFDLDVVMTSESEWGCYPTVPAIAIYQLSAREGIDAVYAARWVWNGKQRIRDDAPLPGSRPPTMPSASGRSDADEW